MKMGATTLLNLDWFGLVRLVWFGLVEFYVFCSIMKMVLSKPQLNSSLNAIQPGSTEVGFDTKMTVHTYKLWIFTI